VRALALIGTLVLAAAPARATEPPDPAERLEPRDEPKRTYYGWQNIVVGYTGELLLLHGFFSESPMLMVTGAATYGLGGMVVHAVHGNATAAAVSPLIMIGVPLLTAVIAESSRTEELGVFTGLYVLGAPLIDSALGHEPAKTTQTVALTPSIRKGSVGLSISGAF